MVNVCKYQSNTIVSFFFFGRGQAYQVKTRQNLEFIQRGFLHVVLLKIEDWEILKSSVRNTVQIITWQKKNHSRNYIFENTEAITSTHA